MKTKVVSCPTDGQYTQSGHITWFRKAELMILGKEMEGRKNKNIKEKIPLGTLQVHLQRNGQCEYVYLLIVPVHTDFVTKNASKI